MFAIEKVNFHVIAFEDATEDDIKMGRVDRYENGTMLGTRFSFQLVIAADDEISFTHNFSQVNRIFNLERYHHIAFFARKKIINAVKCNYV